MLFNGKRIHVRSLKKAEDVLWYKGIGKIINIKEKRHGYLYSQFSSYVEFFEWINSKGIFGHFKDVADAIRFMEKIGYKVSVTHYNINS